MHSKYNSSLQIISEYKKHLWGLVDNNWTKDIDCFLEFIIENLYDESLTVADARKACYIKSKSFTSKFSLFVGTTPKKFILEHRVKAGKILLKETDLTISQIAILIGFSSHSAFSKAFTKKEKDTTPSKWRKKNSGKKSH